MTDKSGESLFRGYHGRVLLSITGGSLFISLVSMVVPPLLPTIIEAFSISSTQAGFVMTVWWLAVSFFNAPGGRLANELSHKTGLIVGLLVAVFGVVLLTSSPVYLTFLLGVAIVGIGRVKLDLRATLARLGRSRDVLLAVVALSLFGFIWNGAISFLPSFLQFGKGFSPTVASIVFAAGLSAFWPVTMAYGLQRLPEGTRTGDRGAITAVFLACEAIGSVYVGAVIDLTNYTVAFASLLALLLATLLVTLWLAVAER